MSTSRLINVCFALVLGSSMALGCGDGSQFPLSGPRGGGGSGGGGAAGAGGGSGGMALTDACLDDLATLSPVATSIQTLIQDACILGGGGCLADTVPCVAQCLEDEIGLAQDCGLCLGMTTLCVLEECALVCMSPETAADCAACQQDAGCNDVFEACAGFPIPMF